MAVARPIPAKTRYMALMARKKPAGNCGWAAFLGARRGAITISTDISSMKRLPRTCSIVVTITPAGRFTVAARAQYSPYAGVWKQACDYTRKGREAATWVAGYPKKSRVEGHAGQ